MQKVICHSGNCGGNFRRNPVYFRVAKYDYTGAGNIYNNASTLPFGGSDVGSV